MNGPLCFIGTCGPWPQIHGKGTLVSATMWSAAMFALFQALLRIEREKVGQLEHELAQAIASAQLPEVGLRLPWINLVQTRQFRWFVWSGVHFVGGKSRNSSKPWSCMSWVCVILLSKHRLLACRGCWKKCRMIRCGCNSCCITATSSWMTCRKISRPVDRNFGSCSFVWSTLLILSAVSSETLKYSW